MDEQEIEDNALDTQKTPCDEKITIVQDGFDLNEISHCEPITQEQKKELERLKKLAKKLSG